MTRMVSTRHVTRRTTRTTEWTPTLTTFTRIASAATPLAPTISSRCRELCRHGRTPGGWTVLWVQERIETPRIVTIAGTDRGCTSGRLFAADQRWIDGRHRAECSGRALLRARGRCSLEVVRPMRAGRARVSRRYAARAITWPTCSRVAPSPWGSKTRIHDWLDSRMRRCCSSWT
jgi:hypothetical protein